MNHITKFVSFLLITVSFCASASWLDELVDGDFTKAESMVASGADINTFDDEYGMYPIFAAYYYSGLNAVEMLVHYGGDINQVDEDGRTLLSISLESGEALSAKLFSALGAKIDEVQKTGVAPIHLAVYSLDEETIRWVLEQPNQNINAQTQDDWNVIESLYSASEESERRVSPDTAYLLVEQGLDLNLRTHDGFSLLHWAISIENAELLSFLLTKQQPSRSDVLLLTELALFSDDEAIVDLITQLVSVEVDNNPELEIAQLKFAIRRDNEAQVEALFKAQWRNHVDQEQWNLLHLAAYFESAQSALFLLENGVDPLSRNIDEYTPLDFVLEARSEIVNHYVDAAFMQASDPQIMLIAELIFDYELGELFLTHAERFSAGQVSQLQEQLNDYFENNEQRIIAWVEEALKTSNQALLNGIVSYVPRAYDDVSVVEIVTRIPQEMIPGALLVPVIFRLAEVDSSEISAQDGQALLNQYAVNALPLMNVEQKRKLYTRLLEYGFFDLALTLLKEHTLTDPQLHLYTLMHSEVDPNLQTSYQALVNHLVELGAKLDVADKDDALPLHHLVGKVTDEYWQAQSVGVDFKAMSEKTRSDLELKLLNKAPEILIRLIGSDRLLLSEDWDVLVWQAYMTNQLELTKALWERGARSRNLNGDGYTLLTALYHRTPTVTITDWLSKEPGSLSTDLLHQDGMGKSLLDYVAERGDRETLSWVLSLTLTLDDTMLESLGRSTDERFMETYVSKLDSPQLARLLHFSITLNNRNLLSMVIDKGVDPYTVNSRGMTAFEAAISNGDRPIIELLKPHYVVPTETDNRHQLYDSDHIRYWSWLYYQHEFDTLLSHLESHLLSSNPHPFARYIWLTVRDNLKRVNEGDTRLSNELKQVLGAGYHVQMAILNEDWSTAVALYNSMQPTATDLWLINSLAGYYIDNDQLDKAWSTLEDGIRLAPNHWQLIWRYLDSSWINGDDFRHRVTKILEEQSLAGTLFEEIAQQVLKRRSVYNSELLTTKIKWAQETQDSRLLTDIAYFYSGRYYREDAIDSLSQASIRFPFYANMNKIAELLAATDQETRLKHLSDVRSKWYVLNDESPSVRSLRYFARAYVDSGNRGKAYQIYQTIGENSSAYLAIHKAHLYEKDKRYISMAKVMEPVLESDYFDSDNWADYITSLDNIGETAKAISVLKQALESNDTPSIDLYNAGLSLYDSASMHKAYKALLKSAVADYPQVVSLNLSLASAYLDQNQPEKALSLVERLRLWWPDNKQVIAKYYLSLTKKHSAEEAYNKLLNVAQNQTWNEKLWGYIADVDKSQSQQVWLNLLEVDPDSYIAMIKLVEVDFIAKDDQKAVQRLENIDWQSLPTESRQDYLLTKVWVLSGMSGDNAQEAVLLERILSEWEWYQSSYGSLSNYLYYQRDILYALGKKEQSSQVAYDYAQLIRDNRKIYAHLVQKQSGTLPFGKIYRYGLRMIERDPYSSEKLSTFLHYALKWGKGTPVIALAKIDAAKRNGLVINKEFEGQARSRLGDNIAEFLAYRNDSGISQSLRYIGWFERARHDALDEEGNQIRYRFADGLAEVDIQLPNGEIITRRDDIQLGKVIYLSRGQAFVKANYNEESNLTRVEDSSGAYVDLTYDRLGQIKKMVSKNEVTHFSYNQNGKPIVIELEGVGTLLIRYDDQGEITEVHSEDGHQVALKLTRNFQSLLSLTQSLERAISKFELPDIASDDPKLAELRQSYNETEYGSEEEVTTALSLAQYLADNAKSSPKYANEAISITHDLFQQYYNEVSAREQVAEAVWLWHWVQSGIKPNGLGAEDFAMSQAMMTWLNSGSDRSSPMNNIQEQIHRLKMAELPKSNWLESNILNNSGYWYRENLPTLLGESLAESSVSSLVSTNKGDVLLGTEQGLLLRRDSFWSWYVYDGVASKFVRVGTKPEPAPRHRINAVTVDSHDSVWVATDGGLFRIDASGETTRWSGIDEELPDPVIRHITSSPIGTSLIAGNQIGHWNSDTKAFDWLATPSEHLDEVYPVARDMWLIKSQGQIAYQNGQGELTTLIEDIEHLVWHASENTLWLWDGDRLLQSTLVDGAFTLPRPVADKSQLNLSERLHSMSMVSIPEVGERLVALTDQGFSIWNEGYFTSLSLPYESQRGGLNIGPYRIAMDGSSTWSMVTEEGLYQFSPTRSQRITQYGEVRDLLYLPDVDVTFAATGNEIIALLDEGKEQLVPTFYSDVNAKILRHNSEGDIISHSRNQVVKIQGAEATITELFDAVSEDENGQIADIYVDHDDSIWVTAGADLFHWTPDNLERYNYYVDPIKFPARSNQLATIFRDLKGDLYVVASDEGHLNHGGVYLVGGLLKLTDNGFVRVSEEGRPRWFTVGYTPISDSDAIVSTTGEFLLDDGTKWTSYKQRKDVSYLEMLRQGNMIFLGGPGAQIQKEDAWLFPSAGGVVGYYKGRWFYPDRINQLLPDDQALGQYGARVIHSVASDPTGRVYVSTDLGLLIYKAGSLASLLTDHLRGEEAFTFQNIQVQTELSKMFLDKIPADSEQGQLIASYQALESELYTLESEQQEIAEQQEKGAVVNTKLDSKGREINFVKEIKKRERKRQKLLAELERDHQALYQMLRLDPREIGAMHDKLTESQILVQYIPTPDKLLTQIVTSEGSQVVQIEVSEEELEQHIKTATVGLRLKAMNLNVEQAASSFEGFALNRGFIKKSNPQPKQALNKSLEWLYDKLLRPIEADLNQHEQIFVTPVGSLNYLPFSALIRTQTPALEYAVERYNIGVLPSMYHFNLVMDKEESLNEMALFISDPDGSLPGARAEVAYIQQSVQHETLVLEGEEASLDELDSSAYDSRFIHFATHGVLDSEDPAASYLLMANNERLGIIDISVMDLAETDIVVLSACESGIGKKGLEYASLARAFAHAKVPTIVASYWQVDDRATAELMKTFYLELDNDKVNNFSALANAQRALILRGGEISDPASWAAFSVFGKP
ncbi:CHAT domain-containing protein [Vibrio aquaticus]|uniref:CHAT domain-containing protein n=1 Tax=Vibrio aquaticus TaxID=2496559 RepID=A0A432D057_9VIBR|nr:CHAT domain-containing protein [Vibrio aquaticus]RTZ17286.1 CHAT domain-containing protein [Vibrio aquaticus]